MHEFIGKPLDELRQYAKDIKHEIFFKLENSTYKTYTGHVIVGNVMVGKAFWTEDEMKDCPQRFEVVCIDKDKCLIIKSITHSYIVSTNTKEYC